MNARLNDKYAQLYNRLNSKMGSNPNNLNSTETAYYNEWADTCLDPEPSPKLKQLYNKLQGGK